MAGRVTHDLLEVLYNPQDSDVKSRVTHDLLEVLYNPPDASVKGRVTHLLLEILIDAIPPPPEPPVHPPPHDKPPKPEKPPREDKPPKPNPFERRQVYPRDVWPWATGEEVVQYAFISAVIQPESAAASGKMKRRRGMMMPASYPVRSIHTSPIPITWETMIGNWEIYVSPWENYG